ncbi:hypothetical protein BC567DRAFT_238010 [Phyllosticta citribraziliensis]
MCTISLVVTIDRFAPVVVDPRNKRAAAGSRQGDVTRRDATGADKALPHLTGPRESGLHAGESESWRRQR